MSQIEQTSAISKRLILIYYGILATLMLASLVITFVVATVTNQGATRLDQFWQTVLVGLVIAFPISPLITKLIFIPLIIGRRIKASLKASAKDLISHKTRSRFVFQLTVHS